MSEKLPFSREFMPGEYESEGYWNKLRAQFAANAHTIETGRREEFEKARVDEMNREDGKMLVEKAFNLGRSLLSRYGKMPTVKDGLEYQSTPPVLYNLPGKFGRAGGHVKEWVAVSGVFHSVPQFDGPIYIHLTRCEKPGLELKYVFFSTRDMPDGRYLKRCPEAIQIMTAMDKEFLDQERKARERLK